MPKLVAKLVRPATLVFLSMSCSSCFTMGLWGFSLEEEIDPISHKSESQFEYDKDTEWSWELLGLRVLLTPLTLCLDGLTAPIQALVLGNDDEEPRSRDCRR